MPFGGPAFLADGIGKSTATVAALSFEIENGVWIVVDEQRRFAVIQRPNDSEVGRTVPVGNRGDIIDVQGVDDRVFAFLGVQRVEIACLAVILENGGKGGCRGRSLKDNGFSYFDLLFGGKFNWHKLA